MVRAKARPFNVKVFLNSIDGGRTVVKYRKDQKIFSQSDPADSVFFIRQGKVKISVVSEHGKEAVIALHGSGDFLRGLLERPAATVGDSFGDYGERCRES